MNLLHGKVCMPVVCQSRGPFFRWHDGSWQAGDELPNRVLRTLPKDEAERCERHRIRRLGMRQGIVHVGDVCDQILSDYRKCVDSSG